jgi:glycosyltransferase involved in cell wall biosynthesis
MLLYRSPCQTYKIDSSRDVIGLRACLHEYNDRTHAKANITWPADQPAWSIPKHQQGTYADGTAEGSKVIANSAVQPQHGQVDQDTLAPRVAILLSTYNGALFLAEQLDSLIAQSHRNWVIYASDDGSSDATLDILRKYQEKVGTSKLVIVEGPRRGFSANFLSLIKKPEIEADFFAYCDQDDLWKADKLLRALQWCLTIAADTPSLYCTRTQQIDSFGTPIGMSPLFSAPPSFRNALVQSLAGGNTMVFNTATRRLLLKTNENDRIISHDWWTYLVVSGCNGAIHYDATPTIGYRQHGSNLIGSNTGMSERLTRLRKMMSGTFRDWNDANLCAIRAIHGDLSADSRLTLDLFIEARQSPLLKRLLLIHKAGVYRQTLLGNLGLTAAAILQRL